MTYDELGAILDKYSMNEDMEGHVMFAESRPDRWFDDPHWRCVNDHVTPEPYANWYTASGRPEWTFNLCKICSTPVRLTFPEDVSGPLRPPKEFM